MCVLLSPKDQMQISDFINENFLLKIIIINYTVGETKNGNGRLMLLSKILCLNVSTPCNLLLFRGKISIQNR